MIAKKVLLEYIQTMEGRIFDIETRMDNLATRIRKIETESKACPCTQKVEVKVKKSPGRPKGSKNKAKK